MSDNISVEDAMNEFRARAAEVERALSDQEAAEQAALVHINSDSAEAVKARLIDARVVLRSKQSALSAARDQVKQAMEEVDKKRRELEMILDPLQKQVARLNDGISAMNLYMGRDEFIHTLREGVPAPADTTISLRQQVLAMDEESTLFAEKGGMDALDIEDFDRWLLSDPAHLDQILPEQKGVVVLKVRASEKRYEDPWQAMVMSGANAEAWWLIRNGENLYRMSTDFEVGVRVVPRADEFTSLFLDRGFFGSDEAKPLQPGSSAWLKAEQAADAKTRHYMKIALILQGLLDRTEVLRPLPAESVSFIENSSYDAGHIRIITDDENVLASNLKPFATWLREKNAAVGIGTRVMFGTIDTSDNAVQPRFASSPRHYEAYVVKRQGSGNALYVTYPRTDEIWTREGGIKQAESSASYRFYSDDNSFVAIDYVTIEEIRAYLGSRTARKSYESMIPVMKAALAFKEKEAQDEAGFRALIDAELEKMGYTSTSGELVFWWKTANKWNRPLVGIAADEAKAARVILAEAKRRHESDGSTEVLNNLRVQFPDAMAVLLKSTGYMVLVSEVYTNPPKNAVDNVYARRITTTLGGKIKKDERWVAISKSSVAKATTLFETEQWTNWKRDADVRRYLTQPEVDSLVEAVVKRAREMGITPANVRIADIGTGWNTSHRYIDVHAAAEKFDTTVPVSSAKPFPAMTAKEYTFYVSKEKNAFATLGSSRSYPTVEYWRSTHNSLISPTKDSPMAPPWDGSNWSDAAVVQADMIFAAEHSRARILHSKKVVEIRRITKHIEDSWHVEVEKKARERYIEDFGDDEQGWEDYWRGKQKTIKFPHSDTLSGNGRFDKLVAGGVYDILAHLIDADRVPYGVTLLRAQEVAVSKLGCESVELPADLATVALPAAPEK